MRTSRRVHGPICGTRCQATATPTALRFGGAEWLVVACLLLIVSLLVGCGGGATVTPEPTPTLAVAQVLPSETPTPTVTQTFTPSVTPTPKPTKTPVYDTTSYLEAERGCEIPRAPDVWHVRPVPDAPAAARAEWETQQMPTVSAEVVAYSEEGRTYHLHPVEGVGHDLLLTFGRDPLPLEVGKTYRFTVHQDQPDEPPLGSALRIEDEQGLLFLGISARETPGAAERLLGGDRGGYRVRQLPTKCRYAPVDPCGYELRAAPVEFADGDTVLTVIAGTAELVGRDPPFLAVVYNSHYRTWVRDDPCEDPTDYPLSYSLTRHDG